jgi:hypothetical protein
MKTSDCLSFSVARYVDSLIVTAWVMLIPLRSYGSKKVTFLLRLTQPPKEGYQPTHEHFYPDWHSLGAGVRG